MRSTPTLRAMRCSVGLLGRLPFPRHNRGLTFTGPRRHCDGNGVYDNSTSAFKYRGTTFSDNNGNYSFKTILPVAYDAGGGLLRPAHFHMMITAEGYQPLVTQLYFNGDEHIKNDAYANSDFAIRRRLDVITASNNSKKVFYDVSMSKIIQADPSAIDRITGIYTSEKDKTKKVEFFKKNKLLWQKNEVYGEAYQYIGNNTFEYPGMPKGLFEMLTFEIMGSEAVALTVNYNYEKNDTGTRTFLKDS